MDCVDHDMFQLRDVGETAERVAESALAATVGLVQCLERFKESDEALHSDNAVLCGLHSIEPPRPILHRGLRYEPADTHTEAEEAPGYND